MDGNSIASVYFGIGLGLGVWFARKVCKPEFTHIGFTLVAGLCVLSVALVWPIIAAMWLIGKLALVEGK